MAATVSNRWTTPVYGFEKYATSVHHARMRTVKPTFHVGPVTTLVVLIVVMSGLAILSLLHSNVTATKGYQFRTVQKAHDELIEQTATLRMRVAELQSLEHLDAAAGGMVVASDVTRVPADRRVALR